MKNTKAKQLIFLGLLILGIVILFYVNLNNPPEELLMVEALGICLIGLIGRFLGPLRMAQSLNRMSTSEKPAESRKLTKEIIKKEPKINKPKDEKETKIKNIDELTSIWMG